MPGPSGRQRALRVHRRRPRLEGRRADHSPEARQNTPPGLEADAHVQASVARRDAGDAGGPECRNRRITMIIARSPFRISLGGGGTDLSSYYREHGGFLIAAGIDKSMYVSVHRTFLSEMVVRYSR